jgi:beta-N-acetylhexosaminidase
VGRIVLAGILAVMGASPAWAAEAEPSLRAGTADAASTSEPAAPFPREATECATHARNAMTLEERVGQLFLLGIGAALDDAERTLIRKKHIGSVTFAAFVSGGRERIRRITDSVQALATPRITHHARFLIAANQEGGQVQALSGPGFSTIPTALAQGRLEPSTLRSRAATWGRQLAEAGVNLNLAPVGDTVPTSWVSINAPIGQLKREFGHTPRAVKPHVQAFIRGMHEAQVLSTVKHFPGLGRVRGNTDFASGVHDTSTRPDDRFLGPFQVAVDAGVPFVMMSLASYAHLDGRTLAAFSKPITTGMLREDLGFTGVIVSDDLSAVAVQRLPAGQRAVKFLKAGGDLITVTKPREARAMATVLVEKANGSTAFKRIVDRAALRVLKAKESAGLLTCSS